jgi:hypothetical protein
MVLYPADVMVTEAGNGISVSFYGPVVDGENWPMISISHPDNEISHPPAGISVIDWLVETGQLTELAKDWQRKVAELNPRKLIHPCQRF